MKNKKARFKRLFLMSLCLYWLIPLAFFLMIFADFNASGFRRGLAYGVGALFWTGVLSGTVVLAIMNRTRKHDRKSRSIDGLPGILSFFKTRQGKLTDKIFIPFAVLSLITALVDRVPQQLRFFIWSVTLFLLVAHSALNGKNYIYMKDHMKG
jgi:hypothetical protein